MQAQQWPRVLVQSNVMNPTLPRMLCRKKEARGKGKRGSVEEGHRRSGGEASSTEGEIHVQGCDVDKRRNGCGSLTSVIVLVEAPPAIGGMFNVHPVRRVSDSTVPDVSTGSGRATRTGRVAAQRTLYCAHVRVFFWGV